MDKLKLAETKQKILFQISRKLIYGQNLNLIKLFLKRSLVKSHLQSYSREGINLILAEEFVKGSRINIILDSRDELSQLLRNQGIDILALK